MTEKMIVEHDRLFQEAGTIVNNQIALYGSAEMSVPGDALTRQLRYAISLYERVLKINPENWSAMWFVGKVHQRLRNEVEALSWFERSYQINPSQPDVAREASLSAMNIGRTEAAVVYAHRATQIERNNPALQANLALAYLLSGCIHEAQSAIERALAGPPSDPISQTIREMIQHFAANGCVPPTSTTALLQYWRLNRRGGS